MTDDVSPSTVEIMYISFMFVISILGSIILNTIFKWLFFEKNNIFTWTIFVAHLFLIPMSEQFYSYLLFN